MKRTHKIRGYILAFCGLLSLQALTHAQSDVTQPGDPLIASSDNSPGSEGVANAIDGQPTKYLNFDTVGTDGVPSGFVVSPSVGLTLVTGITLQSANDAVERDPKWIRLEGSNDEAPTWEEGAWQTIYENEAIAPWDEVFPDDSRFQIQAVSFENDKPFLHYRWTTVAVQGSGANSMQIAEVELLGGVLPGDVTQPSDVSIASSDNSPGSEGVANAFDDQPTKYLNFDTVGTDGVPSGFVITPAVGLTRLVGITLQSANDAVERDPLNIRLEGSNDGSPTWEAGNWEVIYENTAIDAWEVLFPDDNRFKTQAFTFDNSKPFKHYRWTTVAVQGSGANSMQIAEVELLGEVLPGDVTQPSDVLIASSDNSPGSEGVANAIDNQPTKYLNFDTVGTDGVPSGFVVTPAVGRTVLFGLTMQSANDAVERDPLNIRLEGSNDESPTWEEGNWTTIYENETVGAWDVLFPDDSRFQTQTFIFENQAPFAHYRWTTVAVQGAGANSMQIAEVELLGRSAPVDVTQPGDTLIESSDNSPGSEGVANAIDNQPTKYLNFDTVGTDGVPSGFVVSPSVGGTTVIGVSLQSANDAVERDPLNIRLEGSNDDAPTWESGNWDVLYENAVIPAWDVTFPDDSRFQTQEFFFDNSTSYQHYRWTTVEVQGAGANSMQIAEVELLAFSTSADCSKAEILTQPVDTAVLAGTGGSVEFFTKVNGPWPVQWFKNGEPIAGAVQTRYTTEAIDNADDIYTVEIVGCESSDEVRAFLYDPTDQPVSIGLNFVGSGANGTPTAVEALNLGGDQLQAYWNNSVPDGAPGIATGEILNPANSLNEASDISVEWEAANSWGAGTGTDDVNARLLNGIIEGGASVDAPSTITFRNVPEGSHSLLIYGVGRPLLITVAGFKQVQTGETVYLQQWNADDHNPNPIFQRVTSTDPASADAGNYVRFDNIQPVDGVVSFQFWEEVPSEADGTLAVNAVQLVLNALFDPPLDGPDTDGDGLPDVWENGLLGDLSNDGAGDFDEDGLSNAEELANKVDPAHKDTDRDGLEDGPEVNTHGSNPAKVDTDGDTLSDFAEVTVYNTDPALGDTDGDGGLDSVELNPEFNTDPNSADSVADVIVATTSGPWMAPGTWGGTAPVAGQKYAALRGIANKLTTESGTFAGDSLTLIGSTLSLTHGGTADVNLVLSSAKLEVAADNEISGQLTFVGDCTIDAGVNQVTINSLLVGTDGLTFTGGSVDEPSGDIIINGPASQLSGDINIIGTQLSILSGNGLGGAGEGNVLLNGGGLASGAAVNFCGDLIIQGDSFVLALVSDITVRDLRGLLADGTPQFSLREILGGANTTIPSQSLIDDVGFGDDQVTGGGNLVLDDAVECSGPGCDDDTLDTDGDGVTDCDEVLVNGTNPNAADTDGDGVDDGVEIVDGTNAKTADTDRDGLNDGAEKTAGSDPLNTDTDGDSLSDGQEVTELSTDPTKADSDGDGVSDPAEIAFGGDPNDAGDAPLGAAYTGFETADLGATSFVYDGGEVGWSGPVTGTVGVVSAFTVAEESVAITGKQLLVNNGNLNITTDAIAIESAADAVVSVDVRVFDDSSGFENVDFIDLCVLTSTDGTTFDNEICFLTVEGTTDEPNAENPRDVLEDVLDLAGEADGAFVTFSSSGGDIPAGTTHVKVKINAVNDSGSERFFFDNIRVTGSNGSVGGGGGGASFVFDPSFTIPAGTAYDLEYSFDLVSWEVIASGQNGPATDGDGARNARPAGYYRGVTQE